MKSARHETFKVQSPRLSDAAVDRYDPSTVPAMEFADGRYVVRFARNASEIDAALRLRFEVFNLELGEGLESSYISGLDQDRFDAVCFHLIVVERESNAVVGTYRLQTLEMAGAATDFYCSGEFNLEDLPPTVLSQSLEIGRACVAIEHRNSRVLFLLWKGLAAYAAFAGKRYLFGCCSLTSQDANEGLRAMRHIEREDAFHPKFFVRSHEGYVCEAEISAVERDDPNRHLPKLFLTYLRYGAKVCSSPAIDREFKTIDFLVIFDFETLDDITRRLFLS